MAARPDQAAAHASPARAAAAPSARKSATLQHAVRLDEETETPKPKAMPKRVDVAGPGQVVVEILRSGYESPTGYACQRGDRIALPISIAEAAMAAGAVTAVERTTDQAEAAE